MPADAKQRAAHDFLVRHFNSGQPFTRDELQGATGWPGSSFDTYWSKQFRKLLMPCARDRFRVSEAFRPFVTWDRFQKNVVTQVRHASSDYTKLVYSNLIVFEFFMPLNNESELREALDALFYKDTILRRLRSLEPSELRSRFPFLDGEGVEEYHERICKWISEHFQGYSISHVVGRFRAAELRNFNDVAELQAEGRRYLIDETTAIVRFIFPCGSPHRTPPPLASEDFWYQDSIRKDTDKHTEEEADRIRWVFGVLFAQSIVQVVNGEDEIWMVESGMRNCLHIWRVEG